MPLRQLQHSIYFFPMELVGAVFYGVAEGGTQMRQIEAGGLGSKFQLTFIEKMTGTSGEVVALEAIGDAHLSHVDALRHAGQVAIKTVRQICGKYVGDYSYTKVIRHYQMFSLVDEHLSKMKDIVNNIFSVSVEAVSTIEAVISLLSSRSDELTWLVTEVASFEAEKSNLQNEVEAVEHALKQAFPAKPPFADPVRLFKGGDNHMAFDFEASATLIQLIWQRAMREANGSVPSISTYEANAEKIVASCTIDQANVTLNSDPQSTEAGARCCLMIKCIKLVEECSGAAVHDLTFDIVRAMVNDIVGFDHSVALLVGFGDRASLAAVTCIQSTILLIGNLIDGCGLFGSSEAVKEELNGMLSSLQLKIEDINRFMESLTQLRITRNELAGP